MGVFGRFVIGVGDGGGDNGGSGDGGGGASGDSCGGGSSGWVGGCQLREQRGRSSPVASMPHLITVVLICCYQVEGEGGGAPTFLPPAHDALCLSCTQTGHAEHRCVCVCDEEQVRRCCVLLVGTQGRGSVWHVPRAPGTPGVGTLGLYHPARHSHSTFVFRSRSLSLSWETYCRCSGRS